MVGDPSGRSEERNLLSAGELGANLHAIRSQIERFVDLSAGGLLIDNASWFADMPFLAFLRDVGKHASVNVMLARESVSARMQSEAGISYTEFSYQLMQAYDFVRLYDQYGCELQLGGSDQYGNIVAGVDLARRMRGAQLFGFTWPLVTRSDGAKMGKTAEGAVWLDAERTSPYAFYQWFMRVPDADAGAFLRTFTELDHETIEDLERRAKEEPQKRAAQRALARDLTVLVHGDDGLARAERATDALFGGELTGLTEADLLEIFADVPSAHVPKTRLGELSTTDAFIAAGLAPSKGEARRRLDQGGLYVNNRRLEADRPLSAEDLAAGSVTVLRSGKRDFALLRFEG
jgi:tyrosyl-tRNA synthetase